jgi:hypothetical protein
VETTCPSDDCTAAALSDVTLPTVCAVALAGVLVGVAELAGALEPEAEPTAVEMVAWPADTACATSDVRFAATGEPLAAVPLAAAFWAVVAPGLVAADADLALRRDNTMATPIAAMAMPAAHMQYRRTLVTSPLVTTVTLIRSG